MSGRSTPVRAAIYVRVSTADQVDNTSLPEQRRICAAEVERHPGWTLDPANIYADEGKSGTDANRPAFRQMLADARDRKIEAVVVAALDRFSRKVAVGIAEMDTLAELGVAVVVVKERMDLSTIEGRLTRNILLSVAESERDRIVQRTVAGQRAKASKGLWPGGEPSFGWRREGLKMAAHPVPDEREREVIRAAYDQMVRRRRTTGQTADWLNEAGLHPRRGGRWEYQTLTQTLRNPTLWTGEFTWGAAKGRVNLRGKHHTKTDRDGNPLYGDPIVVQMPEPPLTRAEFQSIQRALARRAIGSPLALSKTQMLSGRLYGECGKHYNGVSLTAKDYDCYRCAGRRHRGAGAEKCDCPQIRADLIDQRVWAEVSHLLGDPARLEAMARAWLEVPEDADLNDTEPLIQGLENQIAKHERALERATRSALYDDDPSAAERLAAEVRAELADLRERRDGYLAARTERREKAERLTDLAQLAERARGRLATMPAEQRREVVEILDIRVEIASWRHSKPVDLRIRGQIDPRLFAGVGNTDEGAGSALEPTLHNHTAEEAPSCRSCS